MGHSKRTTATLLFLFFMIFRGWQEKPCMWIFRLLYEDLVSARHQALDSFTQPPLEVWIVKTCPVVHKRTRVKQNFSRMTNNLSIKHRFVSTFPNRPTNGRKTEMMNSLPIRQPSTNPFLILCTISRCWNRAKKVTNYSPHAFDHRALEEEVVNGF